MGRRRAPGGHARQGPAGAGPRRDAAVRGVRGDLRRARRRALASLPHPRDLVWTTGGTVKILGVATDAVLCDRESDDAAAEDVRGLGRMLYAALTAHWPGDEEGSALPAAPASDGVPHAPRQVQAGISHAIDAIVCRCLGIGSGEPLASPADLAKALRGVPRTPLPLFAGLGNAPPRTRARRRRGAPRRRRKRRRSSSTASPRPNPPRPRTSRRRVPGPSSTPPRPRRRPPPPGRHPRTATAAPSVRPTAP
ncbi:hypothetical protein ACFQY7_39570 [Actinomadura luteofluorescens]|uniref:hypothetical protein n=1 Tax=Actinomadura luteofluorescens TaxID=46163 RepID=UPI003643C4D8